MVVLLKNMMSGKGRPSERIQEKGLTLNRDKFAFSMSKLTFMGYLLSNQGIGPTESHVEAVVDAREPQNPFSGISEL